MKRNHLSTWMLCATGVIAMGSAACNNDDEVIRTAPVQSDGGAGSVGSGGSAGASGGAGGVAGTSGAAGGGGTGGLAEGMQIECDKHASATADEACAAFATAWCHLQATCLSADFDFSSESVCVDRFKLECLSELQAPGSNPKPAKYAAIAEAMSGLTCEAYAWAMYFPFQIVGDPAACDAPGTLDVGRGCYVDSQCITGKCMKAYGAACGTCGGLLGEACDPDKIGLCASGLYCDVAQKTCAKLPTEGEACGPYNRACGYGLYCDPQNTVCRAFKQEGAACGGGLECGVFSCGATGTCKRPALGAEGATCNQEDRSCNVYNGLGCQNGQCVKFKTLMPGNECGNSTIDGGTITSTLCMGGSWCQIPQGEALGTCVANAQDGDACEPANEPECIPPALCVNKICTVPSASVCPTN